MALNGFTYSVSWSDFSVVQSRPPNVPEDAQIHPEIRPSKFVLGKKGRLVIIKDVQIDIALVSSDCWVLSTQASNTALLKHEQGHYDIVALSARELFNGFLALSADSTHKLQEKATALQESMHKKVELVNQRYEDKTKNSRNTSEQAIWDKRLGAEKQKPDGSIDNLP